MSFQLNVPPSVVAQTAKLEKKLDAESIGDEPKRQSREDWKKLKELEEARKAGTAPAMQDEEGKDINPHIPQYIMQAPWYFGANQATLRHQRVQEEKKKEYSKMNEWYKRGTKIGTAATKYRKGACENCGAMTHKKKDCLERPRKVGAKYSGEGFAPDEQIQPVLDFDYEGKRDLWNGYDTENHKKIIENYAKLEEAKRQLKSERLDTSIQDDKDKDPEDEVGDADEDEDKYADDVDMPGQKFETKQRITVRNLRIREDTAKYLHNLDVNSAHYDPKTRSMRENPYAQTGKTHDQLPYAGDNFVRYSGDAQRMGERQVFAWEAYEKGTDINVQADPTRLELLEKEYKKRKEDYKTGQKEGILTKYGGEEHLDAPPKQLLLAQTEDYVEYSRHGTVLKGQEKANIKSIYEEDVYLNNHTSVWGSYWKDGKWGFKCCHSTIKESYCTGEAGKSAQDNSIPEETGEVGEEDIQTSLMQQHVKKRIEKAKKKKRKNKKKNKKKKKYSSSSESSSSESEAEDPEEARERRIREAMKTLEERDKLAEEAMKVDERKRPYNVMYDLKAPSEEMMEAYRRKRQREEDPMAQFLNN